MSFNSIFQLLSDNLNNQMLEFLFKCTHLAYHPICFTTILRSDITQNITK